MEIEGLTLSCREIVELVTEHLEGTLTPERRARFQQHLVGCSACALYLAQMHETMRATGTLKEDDVSPEALAALRGAFAGWKSKRK